MKTRCKSLAAGFLLAILSIEMQAGSPERPSPSTVPTTQPTAQPTRLFYVGQKKDEWSNYQDMHAYFLDRFVRSEGFGISRMPRVEDQPRHKLVYADGARFHVGTVELIGLNNGKQPFAYVTGFADASKSLSATAKHVPVDETTAGAVVELKDGKEVVMTRKEDRREFIGAIRATSACLRCHSVPEGTLLGAFRYPLVKESIAKK